MDFERENKTLTLGELLKKPIIADKLNKNAYAEIAKHSTIFSFWGDIAGKKLSQIAKPYKIKDSKVYITTKSATVSQQILFVKNKLLEKFNTYSKPLGIVIEEIVFKGENELKDIKIDENILKSTKESVEKMNFLNKSQKETLVEKILTGYKAEIYRKNIQNV